MHASILSIRPAARAAAAALCAASISLAAGKAGRAQGAGAVATAPETVVTATRIPTPVDEIAGSVRVITAEDIERNQYRTVAEALRRQTGLSVIRSGGPGKQTSVFSRGGESNHTLVLIDGVEIGDPGAPDGGIDFAHVLTQDVERIEVLYGSQGVLYGSDAIGAVINVVTRRGEGPPEGSAFVEGGSFATLNGGAGLRGRSGRFDYAVSAQTLRVGGLTARSLPDDDDGYENHTVGGKLRFAPDSGVELDGVVRYVHSYNEFDHEFDVSPSRNDRTVAEQIYARGQVLVRSFGGRAEHRLGIAWTQHDRRNRAESSRSDYPGAKLKFDLRNDLRVVDGHVATVGLETGREAIDPTGPYVAPKADARTDAVYVQNRIARGPFFAALGGRLDDHESFGVEPTWRAEAGYAFAGTGVRIRGSYATGFKAPSLSELFASWGNPALKPEESRSWEIGFDRTFAEGRAEFGLTWFGSAIDDLIGYDGEAQKSVNVDEAEISGVEVFARAALGRGVRVGADFAYTRSVDGKTGADLLRRPRRKASVEIATTPLDDLSLSVAGLYVGERAEYGGARSPAYVTARVAASWRLTDRVDLTGRIENLFDRDYEDPAGYPQPGIGAFAGLKTRF